MNLRAALIAALFVGGVSVKAPAAAELPPEEVGRVLRLPARVSPHWLWVPDRLFRHSVLFDGDTGEMLGAVDSGAQISPKAPQWSRTRRQIYTVDTTYSKGHRGARKDYFVIYDARTLDVVADVEIPPRSMDTGTGIALFGMLDGERFGVVLNQSPGASVTVIDVEGRRVASEIQTQGCAGVFPAGTRRFGMLCGDGTAMTVHLTEAGELDHRASSAPFFQPVTDPVTEKGARDGSTWRFVSFEGQLHSIDFSGDAPAASAPWPLFTQDEIADGWRVGGAQHVAYHRGTQRFYTVVHQGGPGSHKDPGTEIWVYDVQQQRKVDAFETPNLIAAFLGPQAGFDPAGTLGKVVNFLMPNLGVHSIAITQDEAPLLFYRHADLGAVGVIDARSGAHVRDIDEAGLSGTLLVVP
jgi:methylamine dehydrogenase heavy chain